VEFGVDDRTCGHIELAADQIWLVLTDPPARNRYTHRPTADHR
jgi:hypothetical protein